MRLSTRRGQSVSEYVIVFGVIVGAVVAMQIYLRRGVQARMKDGSDHLASEMSGLKGQHLLQYEPYYSADSNFNTKQTRDSKVAYSGGIVDKTGIDESTTRTGSSSQGADLSKDDSWQ